MSQVIIAGDTSGTITLQAPAVSGSTTLTLPTTTATLATLTTPSFATTIGVGAATASASGAGVTFPATQSASSDANTLDDYEKGTWTAVLGGSGGTSGQTYFFQTGKYTKIGNRVVCDLIIKIQAVGTITGNLQIQGLPFTSDATGNRQSSVYCGYFEAMAANQIAISGFVNTGATTCGLYKTSTAATTSTAMTTSDLQANSVLAFGFAYIV